MTGIIDRLERGGWITRERDPSYRRGVVVQPVRSRRAEVLRLASGMNAAVAFQGHPLLIRKWVSYRAGGSARRSAAEPGGREALVRRRARG
jgi:DNA-binding MarR family transcriptional regulator